MQCNEFMCVAYRFHTQLSVVIIQIAVHLHYIFFFFPCRIAVSNETQTDAKAPRSNVFITLELRQQSESMALNSTCQFTIAAILFVSAQDGAED